MRAWERLRLLQGILCWLLILPIDGAAHSGGLDQYGCHHNRTLGGYHCHRGPLSGQSFASKADMVEQLKTLTKNQTEDLAVPRHDSPASPPASTPPAPSR